MKIQSIKFSGLYSYGEEQEIDLTKIPFAIIVGPNNAGKSNIIRIIQLLIDTLTGYKKGLSDSDVFPSYGLPSLEVNLSLSLDEAGKILDFLAYYQFYNEQNKPIPSYFEFRNRDFLLDIINRVSIKLVWAQYDINTGRRNPSEVVIYFDKLGLRLFASNSRQDLRIKNYTEEKNGQSYLRNFLDSLEGGKQIPPLHGEKEIVAVAGFSPNNIQALNLNDQQRRKLRESLLYMDEKFDTRGEYVWLTTFLGVMLSKKILRSSDRRIMLKQEDASFPERTFTLNTDTVIKPVNTLDGDAQNLPFFLYSLMHSQNPEDRARFHKIRNSFTELFRKQQLDFDIVLDHKRKSIQVNKGEAIGWEEYRYFYPAIVIYDKSANKQVELGGAGAGIGEIIFLLTFIYGLKDNVIVLDEPAINLHPPLMKAFFRLLWNENTMSDHQFLVVTHSADLTHYVLFEAGANLLYVSRNADKTNGSNIITMANESRDWFTSDKKLSYLLDTRMFFGNRVVLTEGPSDKSFIAGLAEYFALDDASFELDNQDVIIIVTNGKGDFPRYKKVLDAFSIPFCLIGDNDVTMPNTDVKNIFNSASLLSKDAIKVKDPNVFIIEGGDLEKFMQSLEPKIYAAIDKEYSQKYGRDLPKPLVASEFVTRVKDQNSQILEPLRRFIKIVITGRDDHTVEGPETRN